MQVKETKYYYAVMKHTGLIFEHISEISKSSRFLEASSCYVWQQ